MFLTRLVYASKISNAFESNDLDKILTVSRRNNKRNHITGMLCFNRKFFLQCIEGSRAEVNRTYRNILNDPRHAEVIMLDYQEIVGREFGDWSMGYLPESSLTAPINLKYSGSDEFDPFEMSGESAHQMMLSLKTLVKS